MLLSALLLAQSFNALAVMNDAQFCEVFQRNIGQLADQNSAPFFIPRPSVDCPNKRIAVTIHIASSGNDFTSLHQNFVANARSGICNLSDPTMATFHERGWRYAYRFVAQNGEMVNVTLNC
ncbi:MAG: hypothetical protein JY451_12140 [Erythrobacter sp.]|nr:MAG: hypothetical protein JY451_12140 [Erythrobacter sp.]